jgi:hypothetical protein
LWEKLSDEKLKAALPYLKIIGAIPVSALGFQDIGKNYKLSPSK